MGNGDLVWSICAGCDLFISKAVASCFIMPAVSVKCEYKRDAGNSEPRKQTTKNYKGTCAGVRIADAGFFDACVLV